VSSTPVGTFSENSCSASSSKVYGGALYLSDCAVEITGGEFSNNIVSESTYSYGGAIYIITSGTANISNCTFESNTAYQRGGAIFTGGAGNVEIKNCNFKNNTVSNSSAKGGAIYVENTDGSVSVNECMFDGNTSPAIAKTQSSIVVTVDGEEINTSDGWDPSSTSGGGSSI
jgi:predicted outer membrane repeat protein